MKGNQPTLSKNRLGDVVSANSSATCHVPYESKLMVFFVYASQDIEVLMTALSSHPVQVLEELNLGYNSIGDQSIEYIAEYIKVCNSHCMQYCFKTSFI